MEKIIYFNNDNQTKDYCSGQIYFDFLDYAFARTDYFMLVYINYYGKGYTERQKHFKDALKKFKVKSRTNPKWPGTLSSASKNTTYKVIFYRTDLKAQDILKEVSKLSDWERPCLPEDLAFFKGNQCWFYSVGHEKIAAIIHATEEDIDFVDSKGLSSNPKHLQQKIIILLRTMKA